ncbi:MAG: hypothetical protein J6C19_16065 [Lachnospiraceae bacterium]|nr:hypothetical protein [Lachnospiraceae bacterium]
MKQNAYREKTDAFFYDNYNCIWIGADREEMVLVYIEEMDTLLDFLGKGDSYIQEFAKDYRLAQKLKIQVNGISQAVKKQSSPYAIIPSKAVVLFQKSGETVYQCSYRKCFQILEYYIGQLQTRFPAQAKGKHWNKKLNLWKRKRLHVQVERISQKLRFWDAVPGNPNTHFEGAKKLKLNPGDIVSFRQLNCQDTLRSLTVNGISKARDLEVLSEYTQLKSLYLCGMGIQKIDFLASLVNLDELGLAGNQITDLSPLAGMKKLTSLYLADNPITDFSVLGELPNLRLIYADLEQMPDQLSWDAVPSRIALRVLVLTPLENYQYHAEVVYSRNSSFVEQKTDKRQTQETCQDSRKLNVKDRWLYSGLMNSLGYPPAVKYDVMKIKTLDCSDHITLCDDYSFLTEIGDYSCLASAVKLQKLNLSGRIVNDFSWLSHCVNIQQLNLSYTNYSDLSLLSGMKQLAVLSLAGCHNLDERSFECLSQLKELKSLDISDTGVHDWSFLKNLDKLNILYLEGISLTDEEIKEKLINL